MSIKQVFLGHEAPALPAAAEYLLRQYSQGCTADLHQVIVVVPGSRAGRRLLEILVACAESRKLVLTPPTIETVGQLPEQLYRPKRPFATELVQRLVWAEALSSASPGSLAAAIPRPPAAGDSLRWLGLADLLRRQHVELAADGFDFGDVAALSTTAESFVEQPRWRALHQLQQAYLRHLDALDLWDIQTARLVAVKQGECHTDRDVVLIGAVDLNITLRRMLDQVSDRVTSLVFAPRDWMNRFDEHGCLIASAWLDVELPIATQEISVVSGPADQSESVVAEIATYGGKYRADEIVIGVPDEKLIPDLQRRLAAAGIVARWGPGQSLDGSVPATLLGAIAAYLEHGRFAEFASLVRHPDMDGWLSRSHVPDHWLECLDAYQNDHLPFQLTGEWLGTSRSVETLRQVGAALDHLFAELRSASLPLSEWGPPLWSLLHKIYGQRSLDLTVVADRVVHTCCEVVRETLREHTRVPAAVMPRVSASQAIQWLLEDLRRVSLPEAVLPNSVEMLGWLELPLDDSPALMVTSFNEGFVPESLNSDLFLPNALRQRLGLLDNARRYARDAYAVSVLTASRPTRRWIAARRNHDGDPLIPSRLLFACDRETTAHRALHCFQPTAEGAGYEKPPLLEPDQRKLNIPLPKPLEQPISELSVTAFRDYLACPYRFYLRHVLRLRSISDHRDELDGGGFGSLAHEVLRCFGTDVSRESTDPITIREVLERELDRCAAEQFGSHPLPAVLVQIEQLRWRLRAFAEKQAEWAAQGWCIEFVETGTSRHNGAPLIVDGEPMWLTGRIDRIDVHRTTGQRVILDYKTSDEGKSPESTHRPRQDWLDLQLPLYRHLAAALQITGSIQMGYVVLPKDTRATQFLLANWRTEDLDAADEIARDVVRRIRREEFWPPASQPPAFSEDFAAICQDAVRDR